MFGYIKAAKPELKVWEYEMYKAVYCTLCRKLGRSYGLLSRFTLSYDFTFLALLELALAEGCTEIKKGRCAFNPLKKCNYCKNEQSFEMPAATAMIMLYYKLKDNVEDEKGIKKLGFTCLLPLFAGAHKKAALKFPHIETAVAEYIETQSHLEKENCKELDRIADPTAKVLSVILRQCSEQEAQKRVLERLGYCLGRYIYILDAACDLQEDIKTNSYNVFKYEYKNGLTDELKEKIKNQLYFCANEAGKAFELLDIKRYKNILGNIIYLGLEETFKKELNI